MTAQHALNATYFEPQLGPVLRPKEASECVGLAVKTLAMRRCVGVAPRFVKLAGNRVGYLKSDLDRFLTDAIRYSTSEQEAVVAA